MNEDQADFLAGKVDALTKILATVFIASPVRPVVEAFLDTLASDLLDPSKSPDHIRGIQSVIDFLRSAAAIADLAAKKTPSISPKGH